MELLFQETFLLPNSSKFQGEWVIVKQGGNSSCKDSNHRGLSRGMLGVKTMAHIMQHVAASISQLELLRSLRGTLLILENGNRFMPHIIR